MSLKVHRVYHTTKYPALTAASKIAGDHSSTVCQLHHNGFTSIQLAAHHVGKELHVARTVSRSFPISRRSSSMNWLQCPHSLPPERGRDNDRKCPGVLCKVEAYQRLTIYLTSRVGNVRTRSRTRGRNGVHGARSEFPISIKVSPLFSPTVAPTSGGEHQIYGCGQECRCRLHRPRVVTHSRVSCTLCRRHTHLSPINCMLSLDV